MSSNTNTNHRLVHRGIHFAIRRVGALDARPEFDWTVDLPPGAIVQATGRISGLRAFARAHAAAVAAIDHWHLEDE